MTLQRPVPVSERLVALVRRELPDPSEAERYLSVLKFAQMAWNVAVLPPGSAVLDVVAEGMLRLPADVRAPLQERLSALVERKKRLFPDDTRVIVEVKLKNQRQRVAVETSHYDLNDKGPRPADPRQPEPPGTPGPHGAA